MSIARFIDHTILKPTVSPDEIAKICGEAKAYSFASVCVPPFSVPQAYALLPTAKPLVATVIGFPFGYSHYEAKLEEMKKAIQEGATELDMVLNLAALKAGDFTYLDLEADLITSFVKDQGRV